ERSHAVARRVGGLDELPARESSRLQPLVDVEVKEADLRLRDASEGVGPDTCQLQQGLLRKPRVERDLQRLQRLYVLLVEPLALRAEAHRPPEPPDRREVQSDAAGRV